MTVRFMSRPAAVLLGAAALIATAGAVTVPVASAAPHPNVVRHHFSAAAASFQGAETVAQRVNRLDAATADLPALTKAYDVVPLWNSGTTGAGTTIATLVSYGDPQIKQVIDAYDAEHGLPPADVSTIQPSGEVPTCDNAGASKADCQQWAGETDLDVAMIHVMAPAAKIVVAATPVAETEGFTGMPEMMQAIDYMTEHHIVNVISMSFATTEETFPSFDSIKTLDGTLQRASQAGVTLVASTGDQGATGYETDGVTLFPYRAVNWPASDTNVTALGGTVLNLDAQGNRISPDVLWQPSGGGVSKAYARPDWQAPVNSGPMRSLPDITMEGTSGTSESAPLFAGVLALAVQLHNGNLGQINPALYAIGQHAADAGIVDVTSGDNSYGGVDGYSAGPGFDTASGWGTVDVAKFVPALSGAVS